MKYILFCAVKNVQDRSYKEANKKEELWINAATIEYVGVD